MIKKKNFDNCYDMEYEIKLFDRLVLGEFDVRLHIVETK
jgi:hypothetical protein